MKKSLRLRIVKVIIPCFSLLLTASLFNHSLAQDIKGKVFRDFNANGLQSATNPIEPGVPGVTVKVFKSDGTQFGSNVTTSTDGSYLITVGSTNDYRVEFSNFPTAFFSGPKGTGIAGSNTSTQFVKGGATANLGINYPSDYCGGSIPELVTPCYINGTPISGGNGANEPAIVSIPYTPTGNGTVGTVSENKYLAKGVDVGATWGVAYQRSSKFLFTSALLKRHVGLGTGGTGAIYKIDNSGSTPVTTLFVDLNADFGVSAGLNPRNALSADSIPRYKNQPSRDSTAFGAIGKVSLGDIDISDDEKTLWVINTFDKKLYELKVGSPAVKPTSTTAHTLPNPNCTNGEFRPWAVKFWRGKVYVGGVCTAENAGGTAADLKAYIYSFVPGDTDLNNFKEVYNFKLDYPRGFTSLDGTKATSAAWKPWIAKWSDIINPSPGEAAYNQTICPQPMLSDIEFDVDGSMILGFMDRAGHQLGSNNYSTLLTDLKTGSTSERNLYEGTSAGDLLRVGLNADGITYTLEKDATVNGVISGGKGQSPSQGPGTGEFYWQDMYGQNPDKNLPSIASGGGHQEISLGGIALYPGKNEVVETVFDPISDFRAGGVRWFDNATGEAPRAYEIFPRDAGGLGVTFGKANGLGDLELLCASQPIEVGNRIFNDIDKDGIQDAGEPVLKGVTVELWKGGVLKDTKITDAVTGEYYFTGLTPNSTDYEIRVPNVIGASKQPQFAGLMSTTAKAGTNNEIDSDAIVTGSNTYASIAFTTGNAGENNHTLDFGLKCLAPVAKPDGKNVTICDGTTTFDLPDAKTGAEAETWRVYTSPSTPAALIGATTGLVTGMTATGKYEFILTNTATSCTDTVSITIKPMIAAGANKTICSPATTSTVNAASDTQTWTVTTKPSGTTPLVAANGNITGLTVDGAYEFTLTEGTCTDVVQITRTAGPNAGADISSCQSTAKLVAAIAGTQTWSVVSNNPSPATIDANGNVSGMVINGDYFFELTSNGCSDIVKVTKTTGVDVTTQNLSVCTAGIVQLTASSTTTSGVAYLWKGPSNFTSNQREPVIANASSSNGGVYTVTASIGGCSATATANVVFKEITVGIIGGFTNVCVGQNLVLRDAAKRTDSEPQVMTYFWSGPDGTNRFTSSQATITIPTTPAMLEVGEYMLVEKYDNGCTVTNMLTVSVAKCQSLGDLVWKDNNNDGLFNNGETGVSNVPVKLFDSATPTVSRATTFTDVNGKYLFRDLTPGSYIVEIDAPAGFKSSTGTNGSSIGAFEPAVDPNEDKNDRDDGTKTTGQLIRSGIVDLTNGGEPENDGVTTPADSANNKNSNRTIDFGIFKAIQIGDLVWADTNKDGIQQATETAGVPNVKVNLYAQDGTTLIATVTSDANGKYVFDNVIPGTYIVGFDKLSIGTGNSFSPSGKGTDPFKNSDADPSTGKTAPFTVTEGQKDLGINAGVIGDCPGSTVGTISVPSLCVGQSLTLKATSSDPNATYAWSTNATTPFTATTQDVTLPNLTTLNSGIYTVLITNSNLCTSALTANVVVNPIPTITVNNASFCAGATGTLTATGGSSYAWSGPSGAFTTTTATLSVTQQGIYTVTGNSNGCTANATTSVTVYPKTVLTATGAAICLGGNGTISVLPAGLKYAWTGPAPFTSTLQTPTIANATDADKGTYTVTVTDGNTCISTATVAVTVGTALTVTPTSNSPVCAGTRLDLSITGGTNATFLWTSPKGVTTNVQNPFTLNASANDIGIWTIAVQNADGCKGSGSVTVDVKPALTGVTATASAPGCTGDNILLTSSLTGAKSYEWSGTPTFASTVQNPTIVKPMADNYTFTVKVTNADGCTALATASTAIYTAPAATATANSPVCFGNAINLGVTTSGTKFAWSGPDGFTNSTQTPSILNASLLKGGIYTVVVTNANSCNATSTVNVIVNAQLNGGNDLSICQPISTAQLTLISGAIWSANNTNPAVATVDANGKVSGMTVNGTYVFTITDLGGCKGTVKVFRNEKLDAGNDVVICSPASTAKLLKLNTDQTWKYFANGQTQPTPTIDVNGNVSGVTQDGSYLFILEQAGITYCADTVTIIRKPTPMAGADQTVKTGGGICEPLKTAKLQAASTGQTWSVASNSVGFGTVAIDASGTVTKMETNGIYTFVLTQGECSDSVKVERIASPTFDVNAVQATCTIGAANPDAKLIVSSTDITATYDYSEGLTYTGTKTFATATAIATPVLGLINPTVDKSYTVRVFNSTGCFTDKTVILKTRVCECKADVCLPYAVRKTK